MAPRVPGPCFWLWAALNLTEHLSCGCMEGSDFEFSRASKTPVASAFPVQVEIMEQIILLHLQGKVPSLPGLCLEREVLRIAPQGQLIWILSLSLIIFWENLFFSTDYMSTNLLFIMLPTLNTTPLFTHHLSMAFPSLEQTLHGLLSRHLAPRSPRVGEGSFQCKSNKIYLCHKRLSLASLRCFLHLFT